MTTSSRRNEGLIPLSREHQYALLLCLRIHRGLAVAEPDAAWVQQKASDAVRFFESDLQKHFQVEEDVLFPAMRGLSGAGELIDQLLAQHSTMRLLRDELRKGDSRSIATTLLEFADTLEAHIRKEERELFPIYEQQASRELMSLVGDVIHNVLGSASEPRNPDLLR